jgi:glycerol-3-phosphate cytidylyltransferase
LTEEVNTSNPDNISVESPYDVYKKPSLKVGFTCGAFDLLHAGHALMFCEARAQCDYLIVAVQTDPSLDRPSKNSPIQSYEERTTMVNAIRWVDEVCHYDTESQLYELLQEINPDVRIVGADWQGKEYTGYDLDIEVYFNSRDHEWSTSSLRDRVYVSEEKKRIDSRREEFVRNSTASLDMMDKTGHSKDE